MLFAVACAGEGWFGFCDTPRDWREKSSYLRKSPGTPAEVGPSKVLGQMTLDLSFQSIAKIGPLKPEWAGMEEG